MTFTQVMVTGHRPQLMTPEQTNYATTTIPKVAKKLLKSHSMEEMISGMALGADTVWAETALLLGVPLAAYIPFLEQTKGWSVEDIERWEHLRSKASREVVLGDRYSVRLLHARNDAMLRDSDLVVAVWSPSNEKGGTASTVRKARSQGKAIIVIDLDNFRTFKENF